MNDIIYDLHKINVCEVSSQPKENLPFLDSVTDSFATEIMNTKRGERYYQKIKKRLEDYVRLTIGDDQLTIFDYLRITIFLKIVYELYPEYTFPPKTNLFYLLNATYHTTEKLDEDKFESMFFGDIMREDTGRFATYEDFNNYVDGILKEKDFLSYTKLFIQYILFEDKDVFPYDTAYDMMDHQLRLTTIKYLGYLSTADKSINEDNFVTFATSMPEIELVKILHDTTINCAAILSDSLKIRMIDVLAQADAHKVVSQKERRLEKWKSEALELRKTVKKQEKIIEKMTKEKDSLPKDEIYNDLLDKNTELARRELKTKKKYNELLEKYNALKLQTSASDDDGTDYSTQGFKELDLDGKYLFIADEGRANIVNNIIETFPNSTVSQDNFNLSAETVDMVVILSSLIDHPTYHNIKNQCKVKNIPLIHCSNTNIDIIKNYMTAEINKD